MNINWKYRQPGLLCPPRNFEQSSIFFGKFFFFGTEVTSEAFLSISPNLKVTHLQVSTRTRIWTCWQNFDLSRSFEGFWGSFMALLYSSRWSDQKCCKTECVSLKPAFKQNQCELFIPIFLQDTDSWREGQSFVFFTKLWNLQRFFTGEPWPWRPWTWCPQGVFGGQAFI